MLTRPQKKTSPDIWGAQNRIYPPSAGLPGPRDPALTPYTIAFSRAVAERRYRRVVMVMFAQGGKTDTLLDCIGHRLDERPAPILYVGPNKQFLTEQFEPRIMALLSESETLAAKVTSLRRMTKTRKVIAGVPLRLAHAGSSTALKSDPAALAITDEADELMANVKGQGDPVGLVDARGDTYADFVHAIVSTPSVGVTETQIDAETGLVFWKVQTGEDVDSTIWKFWQQGTRYHWAWQCPHCSDWFIPRFDCLSFEGKGKELETTAAKARASAVIICPRHGCVITDGDKDPMNAGGVYVAPGQQITADGEVTGDPPQAETASYWVSGLCSPFQSFGDRAARYVEAVQSGDPEKIQTATNAGFGELWAPSGGDAPAWSEVADCKLPYKMGEVPQGVLFLTAGVDVQKRKLVFVVRGWGVRQESWLIDAGELHGSGDTRLDDIWLDLNEQVLERGFDGLRIVRAFVDSGFRPGDPDNGDENKVYEFCRRHVGLCYATKGFDHRSEPISVKRIDVKPQGGRPRYGLDLVRLDSDVMKSWVHSRVRWPKDHPGGWHLPGDVSEEYCRQIVNESRLRKPGGGWTWVPRGPRDYLDCEALAYAGARMLGLERISDSASRRVSRATKPDAGPAGNAAPQQAADPAAPERPRAQQPATPSWLGGRTDGWLRR